MKLLVTFLLLINVCHAYVDFSVNYSFSRSIVEGTPDPTNPTEDPGKAISSQEGYSANWAWYIWEYTALEFNYANTTQKVIDNRGTTTEDQSITINSVDSTVITKISGVGLRQSFASRKSVIIPSIAIGYAKFVTSGFTVYELSSGSVTQKLTLEKETQEQSSSYATVQLRIRLTELIGLSFAAKTVMPDFDTTKAGKNVTYSAGFSWIF